MRPRVYFNPVLSEKFPEVVKAIAFDPRGGLARTHILGTRNIWARDYMPIQVRNHFVKFRYWAFGHGRVCRLVWAWLPRVREELAIWLDGGNFVRVQDVGIVTDIIFKHNNKMRQHELVSALEKLLSCSLCVIPREPYDPLGHSDGMVAKVQGRRAVFINEYRNQFFRDKIVRALAKFSIGSISFPCAHDECPRPKNKYCAFGYYINFLDLGDVVLLPQFGVERDGQAVEILKRHLISEVVPVPCRRLSMRGGCIHCVTVEYNQQSLAR
jgi:hypothetical protein